MNIMISADDVVKVEIYDLKNQFFGATKAFSFTAKKVAATVSITAHISDIIAVEV